MPKYTFTFKKDDIFVDFSTSDKDAVERQFQIWVNDASDYVKNRHLRVQRPIETSLATPEYPSHSTEKENLTVQEKSEEETKTTPETVFPEASNPEAETKQEETVNIVEKEEEVFDKASSLLKTINTIQNQPEEIEEKPERTADFETILEKTIENPTFEPTKTQDQVFLNLVKSKNTTDNFHYLMITAYYLSEFEKQERFSLKQINAKLMQNLSKVIDHTMLQEAINQNLIELIPDLTGTSEVGEYRLTHLGEEFFANRI